MIPASPRRRALADGGAAAVTLHAVDGVLRTYAADVDLGPPNEVASGPELRAVTARRGNDPEVRHCSLLLADSAARACGNRPRCEWHYASQLADLVGWTVRRGWETPADRSVGVALLLATGGPGGNPDRHPLLAGEFEPGEAASRRLVQHEREATEVGQVAHVVGEHALVQVRADLLEKPHRQLHVVGDEL